MAEQRYDSIGEPNDSNNSYHVPGFPAELPHQGVAIEKSEVEHGGPISAAEAAIRVGTAKQALP